jgi:hypothetical protein
MEEKRLVIGFSGGRTSAMMAKKMKDHYSEVYEMIFVFTNTGKELEKTLEFADKCDKEFGLNLVWIEAVTNPQHGKGVSAKVVSFETASRNGEPFEQMIAKHGIPNKARSVCSRELKTYAMRAYCRQIGWKKYYTAIGIRADEADRMNPYAKDERLIYPLIRMFPTTKSDVALFWSKMPFDLEIKTYEGNCDLCWKKSNRKLLTLLLENTNLADWWRNMEEKYGNYVPDTQKHNTKIKLPNRFFRNNLSVDELIEMSKKPFVLAVDESKDIDMWKQQSLFTTDENGFAIWKDYEMDSSNGCEESCEAFSESDLK